MHQVSYQLLILLSNVLFKVSKNPFSEHLESHLDLFLDDRETLTLPLLETLLDLV